MLSADEQKVLDAKLDTLGAPQALPEEEPRTAVQTDDRTLWITAKEINAFLTKQGLGETFRVSLAKDMVDVTLIAPVPADSGVPLLAGTTLRVKMSMILALDEAGARRCMIQDVRVGGVPLPNAWLGDIKGINLVGESLDGDPALQRFFAGIKEAEILPEGIRVILNE